MVGELPIDGECSVCGGNLGTMEEEVEKNIGTPESPQMYLQKWKITRCMECGHVAKRELIRSEKLD